MAHHQARGQGKTAGIAVRFLCNDAIQAQLNITQLHHRPNCEAEPVEQALLHRRAVNAVARSQRRRQIRILNRNFAVKRIGGIDRFGFNQHGFILMAQHGAHGGDFRQSAIARQKIPFFRAGRSMDKTHINIAAQNVLPLRHHAGDQSGRKRADAGNGKNTQYQTE